MIDEKISSAKKEITKLEAKHKKKQELKNLEEKIKRLKRKDSIFIGIYQKLRMVDEEDE